VRAAHATLQVYQCQVVRFSNTGVLYEQRAPETRRYRHTRKWGITSLAKSRMEYSARRGSMPPICIHITR
jgi:hypothetical protein